MLKSMINPNLLGKIILYVAATGLGGLSGWLFYKYIGCKTGG